MKSEREKLQKEKDQVGREGNSKAGNQKGKTFFLEGTLNDKKWQKKNCAEPFPTPQSHVKTCVLVLSTSKKMDLFPVCKLSYCSHTFPRAKIVLGLPWLLPSKQEERRLWFSLLPKKVQPLKGHAEMKLSPKYP